MSGEISTKQIEANRENAKLGGVKTLEGKEISKYNAQKHGILGQTITKYEQESFAGIYDAIEEYYSPQGIMEILLVEKISTIYIKLFRIAKAENELRKFREEQSRKTAGHTRMLERSGSPPRAA